MPCISWTCDIFNPKRLAGTVLAYNKAKLIDNQIGDLNHLAIGNRHNTGERLPGRMAGELMAYIVRRIALIIIGGGL